MISFQADKTQFEIAFGDGLLQDTPDRMSVTFKAGNNSAANDQLQSIMQDKIAAVLDDRKISLAQSMITPTADVEDTEVNNDEIQDVPTESDSE